MRKMRAAGSADPLRFAALAAAGALVLLQGCSNFGPSCSTSDDSNPAELYTGGTTLNGSYQTSDWDGPLLWFPGGKRYDLQHNLGCKPANVVIFVSFSEQGDKGGSIAPSAGNMTILQAVDEQIIRIKNDTCSDYYLRVYADDPRCDADAGPGEAGDARPQDSGSDVPDDAPAD